MHVYMFMCADMVNINMLSTYMVCLCACVHVHVGGIISICPTKRCKVYFLCLGEYQDCMCVIVDLSGFNTELITQYLTLPPSLGVL